MQISVTMTTPKIKENVDIRDFKKFMENRIRRQVYFGAKKLKSICSFSKMHIFHELFKDSLYVSGCYSPF